LTIIIVVLIIGWILLLFVRWVYNWYSLNTRLINEMESVKLAMTELNQQLAKLLQEIKKINGEKN